MLEVDLWTDGASNGKSGTPGGWAFILVSEKGPKVGVSGHEASTTNNRMELRAVIEGLKSVGKTRARVSIHTDSAYVKNPHTRGWITQWQRNGWKSYKGDPVANRDLWEQMLTLIAQHEIKWFKVKGHGHTALNNEVDALCVRAKQRQAGEALLLDNDQ